MIWTISLNEIIKSDRERFENTCAKLLGEDYVVERKLAYLDKYQLITKSTDCWRVKSFYEDFYIHLMDKLIELGLVNEAIREYEAKRK